MDAKELAMAMLDWGTKKEELDALGLQIGGAVLALGKTQTVGNVRASYGKGRVTYDYAQAVHLYTIQVDRKCDDDKLREIEEARHMHEKVSYDYRSMCDCLHIFKEAIPIKKQGAPSVTLKLLKD